MSVPIPSSIDNSRSIWQGRCEGRRKVIKFPTILTPTLCQTGFIFVILNPPEIQQETFPVRMLVIPEVTDFMQHRPLY